MTTSEQMPASGMPGHPGYDESSNTLLTLYRLDEGGVHHETVRIACAILANNRWDGYLSEDKAGERRVNDEADAILKGKTYYFQLPRDRNTAVFPYPIVPTFEHWRFPHEDLPSHWEEIPAFEQLSRPSNDQSCRISQSDYAVEDAHLVPAAQRDWFDRNSMQEYVNSTRIDKMKDEINTICLRSDIHRVFDDKRFAIVPIHKHLVAYCFKERPGSQLERAYHGVELHKLRLSNESANFLLARFAYTVFEHVRGFLDASVSRQLLIRQENDWVAEECDNERCKQFASTTARQGKSRSVSPRKRQRSQDVEELESTDSDWDDEDDEDERRGRKRRRASSRPFSRSFLTSFNSSRSTNYVSVATPDTHELPTSLKPEPFVASSDNEQRSNGPIGKS